MPSFSKIVFGPNCPEALRMVVHHSERLAAAASSAHADLERLFQPRAGIREPGAREAWLIGRSSEIEAFVLDVLADWRRRALTTSAAVFALEAYLEAVHEGMRARVTFGGRPSCCSLDDLITRESPPFDASYMGWEESSAATLVNSGVNSGVNAGTAERRPARTSRSASAPARSS